MRNPIVITLLISLLIGAPPVAGLAQPQRLTQQSTVASGLAAHHHRLPTAPQP